MFKYINMPRLVAYYLKEFSLRVDGTTSDLYKFIFCLCLPFLSPTLWRARLIALMIAECTNSADQVARVLGVITGARVSFGTIGGGDSGHMIAYDGSHDVPEFAYGAVTGEVPKVPYGETSNDNVMYIQLNGASLTEVEGYLPLLIPFYNDIQIRII